ncbi:MAG: alpha/beta hydrolase family protein [Nanobdellota archaeon]
MKPHILIVIGIIGWLLPTIMQGPFDSVDSKLHYDGVVDEVKLFLPEGEGPFPGIVFGAGAGADKALYNIWAEAFQRAGFAVLLRSQSYGRVNKTPWVDSMDDTIQALRYLKGHELVEPEDLLVGGHSGSGNVAYWVGYEVPTQINAVIAVAARFPPNKSHPLKTNLFLATGRDDNLVPPAKMHEVARTLTGRTNGGKFGTDSKVTTFVSDSNHLTEVWDTRLIEETVRWASAAVGNDYQAVKVRNMSLMKIGIMFIAGLCLLIGIILRLRSCRHPAIAVIFFFVFFAVWTSTISRYLFDFGPFQYKSLKYLLALLVVGIPAVILYKKKLPDALFLIGSTLCFVLISGLFVYLPPFSYGGSLILAKSLIVLAPLLLLSLVMRKIEYKQRIIFYSLSLIWLLPVVIPAL